MGCYEKFILKKDSGECMIYNMTLKSEPFQMIKNGSKTIELRLNDDKRSKIKTGDTIVFKLKEDCHQTLQVKVIHIYRFDSFDALYQSLPLEQCGYTSLTIKDAKASDMLAYYTLEKQKTYGVLGIEIKRMI